MLLFAGLGNPGPQYQWNRHNVGFLAVDAIHRRHGFTPWRRSFQGEAAEGELAGERVMLFKPLTFMNESGRAVFEAQRYLKLELSDLFVFHDESELAGATVKVKVGGGHAGHNGLRSIMAICGPEFIRIRIGVGRPEDKEGLYDHVLGNFSGDEMFWLSAELDAIADSAAAIAERNFKHFESQVQKSTQNHGLPKSIQ